MLDIETVGRKPGCAIISIAAVLFNANTGEISTTRRFNKSIGLTKQILNGFTQDDNTIKWWKGTNKKLFYDLCESKNNYIEIAKEFQSWYKSLPNYSKLRLWGNSPKFDIAILEGWYRKCLNGKEFNQFWDTWSERDVRTIAALAPSIKKNTIFVGNKHNPIDDCLHQIKYINKILKHHSLKIN